MTDMLRPNYNVENTSAMPQPVCVPQETAIYNVRLARAYVPFQKMCTVFNPLEALSKGTMFPELYSPYEGNKKKNNPVGDK